MKLTPEDQIAYAKLAISVFENERSNAENIEAVLRFGELIKKYSSDDNSVIYDATEYMAEQLRLLRGEEGAYDDIEMRSRLDHWIDEYEK